MPTTSDVPPTDLRLTYSPGWSLFSAFVVAMAFIFALLETSFVHPLVFPKGGATPTALWVGFIMPFPLWFLTHFTTMAVFKLIASPFGIPGKLALSQEGVELTARHGTTVLRWSEVSCIESRTATLDWDAVSSTSEHGDEGKALAELGAELAAKDWDLRFRAHDGRAISVTSTGFRRPLRRAEPQLRSWIDQRFGLELAPLSTAQAHTLSA